MFLYKQIPTIHIGTGRTLIALQDIDIVIGPWYQARIVFLVIFCEMTAINIKGNAR